MLVTIVLNVACSKGFSSSCDINHSMSTFMIFSSAMYIKETHRFHLFMCLMMLNLRRISWYSRTGELFNCTDILVTRNPKIANHYLLGNPHLSTALMLLREKIDSFHFMTVDVWLIWPLDGLVGCLASQILKNLRVPKISQSNLG